MMQEIEGKQMTDTPEFNRYPKIARYENEKWTISEKIDGTNGVIFIPDTSENVYTQREQILCGARNGWLTGVDSKGRPIDNHGFRAWVEHNWVALLQLGAGTHHGEWYGKGINRGYGLSDKRFMLFNRHRYEDLSTLPSFVEVESVVADNISFNDLPTAIEYGVKELENSGSFHVKGFRRPEGFIIRSLLRNTLYKVIIDK